MLGACVEGALQHLSSVYGSNSVELLISCTAITKAANRPNLIVVCWKRPPSRTPAVCAVAPCAIQRTRSMCSRSRDERCSLSERLLDPTVTGGGWGAWGMPHRRCLSWRGRAHPDTQSARIQRRGRALASAEPWETTPTDSAIAACTAYKNI